MHVSPCEHLSPLIVQNACDRNRPSSWIQETGTSRRVEAQDLDAAAVISALLLIGRFHM